MLVRIFHTLPSERRTSMEVHARQLGSALRQLIGNESVIDVVPDERLTSSLKWNRRVAWMAHYVDRYWTYQSMVARVDEAGGVNHIVDHGYGHLASHLDSRRTVVTFHDAMLLLIEAGELRSSRSYGLARLGHRYSLRSIRRVARVIADSNSSRRDFLRFNDYDPEKVVVVPLGVDSMFQPPISRSRLDGGPLRLLHVGHNEFYKNVDALLIALPRIGRLVGHPVVLLKVGEPFTTTQRELIDRLQIHQLVDHRGPMPHEDLPPIYADADVLVMPSLHEGFGLPVLEAMACGTPVAASNRGSLPEVVGSDAVLFEPDPESIAEAVSSLLCDPAKRDQLSRRGPARAAQYSWTRAAQETLRVYEDVLAEVR